jgi:hypothetical protein
MVPGSNLYAVEKREVCCVWLESDLDSSGVQSVPLLTAVLYASSWSLTSGLDMHIVIFVPVNRYQC